MSSITAKDVGAAVILFMCGIFFHMEWQAITGLFHMWCSQ